MDEETEEQKVSGPTPLVGRKRSLGLEGMIG